MPEKMPLTASRTFALKNGFLLVLIINFFKNYISTLFFIFFDENVPSLVYCTEAYFMPKNTFFLVFETFGLLEKNLSQNDQIDPSKSHFCPVYDVQSCRHFVQASFMPTYA